MKFKFPKKIKIGAYDYKVVYDKKSGGGSFALPYKGKVGKITIGTRDMKGDNGDFLGIVLHELSEIIHVELCSRFTEPGTSDNYFFNYRHDKHTALNQILAGLLKEFIQ